MAELPPGERMLVDCGGRSVGVFNIDGTFVALHNRCPHQGAPLCVGPLSGTAFAADDEREYVYEAEGRILRCPWHGWEFDVVSGEAVAEQRVRVRRYKAVVEDDRVVIYI